MIEIIELVLVDKFQCKVLLVTHSPSTVAMSPNESTYVFKRKSRKIQKVSKEVAFKELTRGVNFLSISHENIRQVFVEDEDDVYFHRFMFNILNHHLVSDVHLNFIAAGKSKDEQSGGCSKVKSIVRELYNNGNKTVFGIIDFDLVNQPSPPIFTISSRYSIENYIFDPIYVIAFLIREKLLAKNELGLPDDFRYTDIEQLDQATIQEIIDKYLEIFGFEFTENTELVKYTNEIHVEVPREYLYQRGHELEERLRKVIGSKLHGKIKNHKSFKYAIIADIIDDLREFIPVEIARVYREIQKK